MSERRIKGQCEHCHDLFSQVPKKSFLGFQKIKCASCEKITTYPLTSAYRTTYWVLFVLMALQMIGSLSDGVLGLPGGIGIALIIALIKDTSIKKKTASIFNE